MKSQWYVCYTCFSGKIQDIQHTKTLSLFNSFLIKIKIEKGGQINPHYKNLHNLKTKDNF